MLCPNGTVKPFLVSLVEPVAYLKSELQIPLDLVVCWGALVGVLALLFIKREMETHYDIEK